MKSSIRIKNKERRVMCKNHLIFSLFVVLFLMCYLVSPVALARNTTANPNTNASMNANENFNTNSNSNLNSNTNSNSTDSYETARNQWRERLQEMKANRSRITAEIRAQNLERARNMVDKAIGRAINHLQRVKTRVSKMTVLTAERREQISNEITAQITTLQSLEEKIKGVKNKEELKAAVQEVRNQFAKNRELIRKIAKEIFASHLDKILTNLNTVTSRIETEINNLKSKGEDVSAFEKTLSEVKSLLAQAKEQTNASAYKEAYKLAEQAHTKLAKLAGEIKSLKAKLQGGNNETQ
jgi:hypothetical protein